jgi:tetratricopeptide (TPR) repeat protein
MRHTLAATVLLLLVTGGAAAQDKAAERDFLEARRHYDRGQELMLEESFEEAAAEFRTSTKLDPQYTLAHYSLGQANMVLKRYEEAAEAYEDCRETILALSSMDVKRQGEMRQERIDELQDIEAAILRWGGPEAPPRMQTMRLMERKRLLEQQQEKEAVTVVAVPAELSLALGSAYFRLGRHDDAQREFLRAIEDGDKTGAAHNNVAVIYMMKEEYDEARRHVVEAEEAGFRVSPLFKDDLRERTASAEQ